MFSIDGVQYNVKCTIEREAEIKASDISGMLLDGVMFYDILGTYMSYDISLVMPLHNRERYATLIEQLTEPVGGHAFVLPYNGATIQITGKVESPRDVWVKLESGYTYWQGLRFTVTSNAPTKSETLGEVIARGLPVVPDVSSPEEGDAYIWDGSGWVALDDADGMAF